MNSMWVEPFSDLKHNRPLGTYPFEDSKGLNTNNQKGIPRWPWTFCEFTNEEEKGVNRRLTKGETTWGGVIDTHMDRKMIAKDLLR